MVDAEWWLRLARIPGIPPLSAFNWPPTVIVSRITLVFKSRVILTTGRVSSSSTKRAFIIVEPANLLLRPATKRPTPWLLAGCIILSIFALHGIRWSCLNQLSDQAADDKQTEAVLC